MPPFYTKKGDKGSSRVGNKEVPKNSSFMDLLGELDELNSLTGLVKSEIKGSIDLKEKLHLVQEALFIIQAQVAEVVIQRGDAPCISEEKIKKMETEIENIQSKMGEINSFVISGEGVLSARLDYLRAVTRRVERKACALNQEIKIPQNVLSYLNRLSSYFYALARMEDRGERKPKYE